MRNFLALSYTGSVLSLILPTYNEADNLPALLPALTQSLAGIDFEIIVVDDDSPDLTWKMALSFAKNDQRIRVIRRVGRRGLSSAVIEGFLAATGDVFAVMDADGQHDLSLVRKLNDTVANGADIAIGSRYVQGGGVGTWDERRHALSLFATRLAIRLCKVRVHDPMSGFFAVSRRTFEAAYPRLNPKGFKILLDILVHVAPSTRVEELPFTFGERLRGESKLSRRVQLEFLEYLYDVTVGRFVPLTFVKYCLVGLVGVVINLLVYLLVLRVFLHQITPTSDGFLLAMLCGIEAAIIGNFLLNNLWTYAFARLKGVRAFRGFLSYNAACLFGALANTAITVLLMQLGFGLWGLVVGALIGTVWNYTVSRLFTWNV